MKILFTIIIITIIIGIQAEDYEDEDEKQMSDGLESTDTYDEERDDNVSDLITLRSGKKHKASKVGIARSLRKVLSRRHRDRFSYAAMYGRRRSSRGRMRGNIPDDY